MVQHVLVSFAGKLPGKLIQRSEDEARQLANEILAGEIAEGCTLRVDAAADGFIFTSDPTPETQSA